MVLDEKSGRLYVANGNEDSVSVIDTSTDRVVNTLVIKPFREAAFGAAPTALALSHDGSTLYVACGGLNAIAVFRTSDGKLAGMIPTAWYPAGLALSPDGKYLAVSTLLGEGSGYTESPKRRFALGPARIDRRDRDPGRRAAGKLHDGCCGEHVI